MKRYYAYFFLVLVSFHGIPVYAVTATYTPPAPTPTPLAYPMNIRAHTQAQALWEPRANRGMAYCDILNQPANGTATCPDIDPFTGKIRQFGKYTSNSGFAGVDVFEYQLRDAQSVSSNSAQVTVDVSAPCRSKGCYSLTRMGNIWPAPFRYRNLAVNDLGEVAGSSFCLNCTGDTAFFWSPMSQQFKILNDLLTPLFGYRPLSGGLIDINNSSQVLNYYSDTSWPYTSAGSYVINPHTESISGPSSLSLGGGVKIDNGGRVLISGVQYLSYPNSYYATYLWDPVSNATTDISAEVNYPPQSVEPRAQSINDAGQIIGQGLFPGMGLRSGYYWNKVSGFINFGGFGYYGNWPIALNNSSSAVGVYFPFSTNSTLYPEAFLWSRAAGPVGLGYLSSISRNYSSSTAFLRSIHQFLPEIILRPFSYPVGIDDSGTVVGISSSEFDSYLPANFELSAVATERFAESFIWTTASGMVPLFSRMDASGAGWHVEPRAVSNRGLIVGVGVSAGLKPELVLLKPVPDPVADNVTITVSSGQAISWIPLVSEPNGGSIMCRLDTLAGNGTATIDTNCSSGTYQSDLGFIGTDRFTYIATSGGVDSTPGTVTVAVTEGSVDQACIQKYPITQLTQAGKEGTLTISFTGNITSHTNKAVNVCPGTTLKYQTTSTQGPVVCKVKNNTTRGSGRLKINDHIKCSDKPAGKDKVQFKVKSGVTT